MRDVAPARRAAFRILLTIESGKGHSDELLRGKIVDNLSAADRNLVTTFVFGITRWQMYLDEVFRPLLKRPRAKLDSEVLTALRLGAFQILFLDRIPARAAIDESVELTIQSGHRFASGMVNAVLRKLASEGQATRLTLARDSSPAGFGSPGEWAFAQAHPAWMVERWIACYGAEAACSICRHGQSQPALSVRIASSEIEGELTREGIQLEPGDLLSCARTVVSRDVTATAAFREGRVRIQDEGSQLIAELAACSVDNFNQNEKSVLDTCAAPGGKTLILAERLPDARIVACESSPQRLAQLHERLAAYAEQIECRLVDAAALEESDSFGLVLADVPCSGTGTLGRNPEIRHRLKAEDLARHAERQRGILRAAIRTARPGGRIVYSTCSLEREENEQVVAEVVARASGVRRISLDESIDALLKREILTRSGADHLRRCLTTEGSLCLLPGAFHTDGFFIALVEKLA